MRFFFSGEIQSDIGDDFSNGQNEIVDLLTERLSSADYGLGVVDWGMIPIVRRVDSPDYDEIKRYWRKKKETEFRLKIDHATFKRADFSGKKRLIFENLLESIRIARTMKIPDFDFNRFESDVRRIGQERNWCD